MEELLVDVIDIVQYKDIIGYKSKKYRDVLVEYMNIKDKSLDFEKGEYVSISFNDLNLSLVDATIDSLNKFYKKSYKKVLVCGFGNPNVICDSLGPLVCKKIHSPRIMSIIPNVYSETGIKSYMHLEILADALKPDLVILIDSLRTTFFNRVLKNIQISTNALIPGSGIYEKKNKKIKLNCDVLTIGIPTIIDGKSINKDLPENVYLTYKDIDSNLEYLSFIIANSINSVF